MADDRTTAAGGGTSPAEWDPERLCQVCGHRLDVQVYPDHVESSCKVCRVRARRRATDAPPHR